MGQGGPFILQASEEAQSSKLGPRSSTPNTTSIPLATPHSHTRKTDLILSPKLRGTSKANMVLWVGPTPWWPGQAARQAAANLPHDVVYGPPVRR